MKRIWIFAVWFAVLAAPFSAQTFSAPEPSTPSLTTADRVAIQSLEKTKADAAKQWQDAQQQELTILREWQVAHPGWHIDQGTFAVTPDPKPAEKK